MADADIETESVENGGITTNVADEADDNDIEVEGVKPDGSCVNADDCSNSNQVYNDDGTLVTVETDDASDDSTATSGSGSTTSGSTTSGDPSVSVDGSASEILKASLVLVLMLVGLVF